MKRTRLIWVVLAVGLVCALAVMLLPPRPGVNHRNLKRIQNGMVEGQVEAILGGSGVVFGSNSLAEGESAKVWTEKEHGQGGIIVYFDRSGAVYRAVAFPFNEVPP